MATVSNGATKTLTLSFGAILEDISISIVNGKVTKSISIMGYIELGLIILGVVIIALKTKQKK